MQKLAYIDNLRIMLITSIIMLHVSITYGAAGSWYYYESSDSLVSAVILTLFNVVVQAFSLNLFFMISGYFTPKSLRKKGPAGFIKDRFLRLGIPLAFYYFVINPSIVYLLYVKSQGKTIPLLSYFGTGPLWFVEALLIFNLVYLFGNKYTNKSEQKRAILNNSHLIAIATIHGLLNFAVRFLWPLGTSFSNLQFSYFPGYVIYFIVGLMASEHDWFASFDSGLGRKWLRIGVLAVFLMPVIMVLGGAVEDLTPFNGGLTWQAFVLSFWEAFAGLGFLAGFFVIFREKLNRQSSFFRLMGESTYAVYVIHGPVIILLAYSARNLVMFPLLKFVLISTAGVSACFLVSTYVLKKIPLVNRIL